VVWPLSVRAQQPNMRVIGFLSGRSHDEAAGDAAAFRDGLKDMGYIEGRNLAIEKPLGRGSE
jgi:putative tryptophan/tyrosine transport system substrate-binding protein